MAFWNRLTGKPVSNIVTLDLTALSVLLQKKDGDGIFKYFSSLSLGTQKILLDWVNEYKLSNCSTAKYHEISQRLATALSEALSKLNPDEHSAFQTYESEIEKWADEALRIHPQNITSGREKYSDQPQFPSDKVPKNVEDLYGLQVKLPIILTFAKS